VHGTSRNIDVLGDRADLQGDISPKLVVHLERNTAVGIGLKSSGGYREFVRTRLQGKEMVSAIGARRGLLANVGLHIHDSDLRASDHRLPAITNRARNRAGYVSARCADAENQEY
jgi:hypothetical protein